MVSEKAISQIERFDGAVSIEDLKICPDCGELGIILDEGCCVDCWESNILPFK